MTTFQMPPHASDALPVTASIIAWAASLTGWIPLMAAILVSLATFFYYMLNIFSHPTVARWIRDRRERRIIRDKTKLLSLQLAMLRTSESGDTEREFWRKVVRESRDVLDELLEHQAYKEGLVRQSLQIIESKQRVLDKQQADLTEAADHLTEAADHVNFPSTRSNPPEKS